MVSVQIDEEKIREMAFYISQEPKSWEDFIWLFSEADFVFAPHIL